MKRLLLGVLLSVTVLFLHDVSAEAKMSVKALNSDMEKGSRALDYLLLEKTINGFESLLEKNPEDKDLLYGAAKAYFAAADCLDITSKDEFDKSGKGEEKVDTAIVIIEELLEINDNYLNAYILKYYLLEKKITYVGFPMLLKYVGAWNSAAAGAQKISPEDINVLLLKAHEASSGMPRPPVDKSIAGFEKVLKKAPEMADIYFRMGVVFDKGEQKDNAKKNYLKAISLDPYHHWAKKKLKEMDK